MRGGPGGLYTSVGRSCSPCTPLHWLTDFPGLNSRAPPCQACVLSRCQAARSPLQRPHSSAPARTYPARLPAVPGLLPRAPSGLQRDFQKPAGHAQGHAPIRWTVPESGSVSETEQVSVTGRKNQNCPELQNPVAGSLQESAIFFCPLVVGSGPTLHAPSESRQKTGSQGLLPFPKRHIRSEPAVNSIAGKAALSKVPRR